MTREDRRPIVTLQVRREHDVVLARQTARHVAELLGFDVQDRARIATAVSEIARNARQYAGGARLELATSTDTPELLVMVADQGPGIPDLGAVLEGRYRSRTGMGLGVMGSRRLMDRFEISSSPGQGTTVLMGKTIPGRSAPFALTEIALVAQGLAARGPGDPYAEVQQQNQDLLRTLDELRVRQAEMEQLNRELEDTNRGVVALYAELDEKADSLQRANELKTRFLSNMSHEFRTPLNSILSLARILLDRVDGELVPEQEKQVQFIRRSAEELSELVNDLLDIAKVEAGKVVVRPSRFEVTDVFSGLRGMLRPLLAANSSIQLTFVPPLGVPHMRTDEGKVSQIMRNFISNALKFTESGEVRVGAERQGDAVRFTVSDTGIGIAPEDQERIFEEFVQLEVPIERASKGTGLGLPLSRRLAELLGGSIGVESELGVGSTFHATIPIVYSGAGDISAAQTRAEADPTRLPVVVVEDSADAVFTYEKLLKGTGFQVLAAGTVATARALLAEVRPLAVIVDVPPQDESTWELMRELKADERMKDVPIFMITVEDDQRKASELGVDALSVKPVDRKWLVRQLRQVARRREPERVLVIDDDEVSRYVLQGLLADTRYSVIEARDGDEGLRRARTERPEAIFLDLGMPDLSGEDVLRELKADEGTRDIPVIVYTSRPADEVDAGCHDAIAVITKDAPSREAALAAIRAALARAQEAR